MRLTNPMATLTTTPRRLVAAFLVLLVVGAVATLTIRRASSVLSGTTANTNTYSASSCFLPVPVSMVAGNAFSPTSKTIAAGCSIKWTNTTSTNHNTRSTAPWVGLWSSSNFGLNGTFTQAFPTAGTYPYRCSIHSGVMTGTIIVT